MLTLIVTENNEGLFVLTAYPTKSTPHVQDISDISQQ